MFLPNDLQSRLKGLRKARLAEPEAVAQPSLVAWTAMLIFGCIAMIVVAIFSYYRFSYWQDIDARLAEQDGAVTYDETALRTVLENFETKATRAEAILSGMSVAVEPVATTTATTTATTSEDLIEE